MRKELSKVDAQIHKVSPFFLLLRADRWGEYVATMVNTMNDGEYLLIVRDMEWKW